MIGIGRFFCFENLIFLQFLYFFNFINIIFEYLQVQLLDFFNMVYVMFYEYFCFFDLIYRDFGGSVIYIDKQVNIDFWIIELYVDFMCQFRFQEVYNYIKLNEGYRLE